MIYRLSGINYEKKDNPIRISAIVDASVYEEIKVCQDICCIGLVVEERFQLALDNFQEWETELLQQAQYSILWKTNEFAVAMQHRLTLDRRFINLLSAFRLYLDQSDHNVSTVCGDQSDQLKLIKEFKNKLYNEYFGYRFLEALRNHVQHSALPLHTIGFNQSLVNSKEGPYVQFTVQPRISIEEIAENERFKQKVLHELKEKMTYLDLRLAAREYVYCLTLLHAEIRAAIRDNFSKSRAIYESAVEKYSKLDERKIEHVRLEVLDENGFPTENVELVTEFLKLYDALRGRNSQVNDIRRFFTSNAVQKQ